VDTSGRSSSQFAQLLRNTAKFSGVLSTSVLCGLVTAKVLAISVGPFGYGVYGLYNTYLTFLLLAGGLGLPNAFTRLASREWRESETGNWPDLWRAAKMLTVAASVVSGLAVILFRVSLGVLFTGRPLTIPEALIMTGASLAGLHASLEHTALKTQQRINAIVWLDVATTIVHAVVVMTCVLLWHTRGILPAIGLVSFANWAVARIIRGPVHWRSHLSVTRLQTFARLLLRYGVVYWLTALITTSAGRLLIPLILLHETGSEAVGLYTVASSIMSLYTSLLASAMGRDYFPKLASSPTSRVESLLYDQQQVVMYIGLPSAVVALTLTPVLLPIVYTLKFVPAVPMLIWMFAGSLCRYFFWSYSYILSTHAPAGTYLRVQLAVAMINLGGVALGLRLWGLVGVGVGYFIAQVLSLLIAYKVLGVRLNIGIRADMAWTLVGAHVMLMSLVLAMSVLPQPVGLLIGLGLSAPVIGWSWFHIIRHGDFRFRRPFGGRV
jgi:antigen flippase